MMSSQTTSPNSPPRPVSRKSSIVQNGLEGLKLKRTASTGVVAVSEGSGEVYSMTSADYELGTPIGFGSSAIVYIAKYRPLNKNVAIKMIDLDMFERNQIDELRREIQIMSLSKHPHLLPVYGSFVNESKLYIVTPFLSAGSCLDIMKTSFPDGFEEVAIATILKQALLGLDYLHKNGLIHRDVKAGNLLVNDDGLVQLADFGVSSSLMETGERKGSRKTFVGTPCWMAPEVMEQSGYDYKADIWSFGITALELATGHAPFAKYPPMKVLLLTLQNDPPSLDRDQTKHRYSKSFKDMIDGCMQKDPSKRPVAEKLLQHPFFKQGKKQNYLVQSILHNLGPVQHRPHNKKTIPQKKETEQGDSWDFSTTESEERENLKNVRFDPLVPEVDSEPSSDSAHVLQTKKSRFVLDSTKEAEVVASPLSTTTSTLSSAPPTEPTPTPPTPSAISSVSQTEVKRGRFTVNEGSGSSQSGTPAANTPASTSTAHSAVDAKGSGIVYFIPDKRGRFQVSAAQESSGQGSPAPSPPASLSRNSRFTASSMDSNVVSLFSDRIELLVKQNESQRHMLNEVVSSLSKKGLVENGSILNGVLTSDPAQSSILSASSAKKLLDSIDYSKPQGSGSSNDLPSLSDVLEALRQLERQLHSTISQVDVLRSENEELRKENEQLKQQGEASRKDILLLKAEIAEVARK